MTQNSHFETNIVVIFSNRKYSMNMKMHGYTVRMKIP